MIRNFLLFHGSNPKKTTLKGWSLLSVRQKLPPKADVTTYLQPVSFMMAVKNTRRGQEGF
jgi:uncharacterized lipoprotein YbaY